MGEECLRYHRRLAELFAMKRGEDYAKAMNWIRAKISFSLICFALVCLRGSRSIRRNSCNIMDIDIDIQTAEGDYKRVWDSNTNLPGFQVRVFESKVGRIF